MNTISTIRNNVSILILASFTLPLIIHSMVAFIWLLQMDMNLFPYDKQLYAFFIALSVFLIPFMKIVKGQINSLNTLAISVFILYELSLNSNSITSNSDFDWGKLMVTTLLSATAAWIVYSLAKLIKVQAAQKLDLNLKQDDNDETENTITGTTIEKQDIHNRLIDNIIGYKDNVSELKRHRNHLSERLEQCRSALLKYIKKDLNSKAQFCSTCDNELSSIKHPNQN